MYGKKYLVVLFMLLFAITACTRHRVKSGVLRDTLFSVEETNNGYWRIWMTHDDIAGYCTNSEELGKQALSLLQEHNGEVVVEFAAISANDPEFDGWDRSECGTIYANGGSTEMFVFTSIVAAEAR